MHNHSVNPAEIFRSLMRNRTLIAAAIRRDVAGRYRGSILGILWSFLTPLIMLLVYTLVFGVVYKSRWGDRTPMVSEFAMIMFAGLIVFNLFQECVNRAPNLILANPNFVKKVVYPLEVLPIIAVGSAVFHAAVSLVVWLIAYLILNGIPHLTVLLLPICLVPLIFLVVGLGWFLGSLGVYLRDTSQVVGIVTTIFLFLTPIFYSPESLSANFPLLLNLNPLAPIVESARQTLYWGVMPDFQILAKQTIRALIFACIGFAWFQRTRSGFSDVL
jgi:lipopolysaccharide transport system permease protein